MESNYRLSYIIIIIIIGLLFINFINTKSLEIFQEETVKLEFELLNIEKNLNTESYLKIYKSTFNKRDFEKFNGEINKLVFYRMNSISYKVYVNNKLIGYMNPYEKHQGKMISNYKSYDLSKKIIKDKNEIIVKSIVNRDDILSDFPIVLTSTRHSYDMKKYIVLFFQFPFILLMAIILFLLIFFIALNMKMNNSIGSYFYYSGSSAFLLLNFIEIFNPFILNISLLDYKKILILSFWMPVIFLNYKFYEEFKMKILKYNSFIMLIILSIPILLVYNLSTFFIIYKLILPVLFICSLIWVYKWIREFKNYKVLRTLFPFVILMFIFGFYDGINHILGKNYNSFSFYAVLLFNILLIIVISEDYYKVYADSKHHKEKFEEISELSKLDSMTGIYNYEYIQDCILKSKEAYSLMIIDIDNFKYINDRYGHLLGDRAILRLVEIMKENSTSNELLSRFGGDEFVIVGKDKESLDRIAKKLVNGFKIENNGNEINIFLSIGLTHSNRYLNIDEMFKIADENLYEAKRSGKSKIIANVV